MGSEEPVHSHYWPGDGCIPISPQARRVGWTYEVYVTRSVWSGCISWTPNKKSNPDKRIFELLESTWQGMGKALSEEGDRLMYRFKHWYWERGRPKARKQRMAKLGARLLLDPETEEPWILIFDPQRDGNEVLKHGEPTKDREDGSASGETEPADDTRLDLGIQEAEPAS